MPTGPRLFSNVAICLMFAFLVSPVESKGLAEMWALIMGLGAGLVPQHEALRAGESCLQQPFPDCGEHSADVQL